MGERVERTLLDRCGATSQGKHTEAFHEEFVNLPPEHAVHEVDARGAIFPGSR